MDATAIAGQPAAAGSREVTPEWDAEVPAGTVEEFAPPASRLLVNRLIAGRLGEVAGLLGEQGADPFRVRAYLRAARSIRAMPRSINQVFRTEGLEGLEALPHVGENIARAIRELLVHGRLPMLDRLRGEADPIALLSSVAGIGTVLARRLHDEFGIESLDDLEAASHDGRLEKIGGFGPKRLAAVRETLGQRLSRLRTRTACHTSPPVDELLDVDREYRAKAAAGELPLIAPRRFNPTREAWLPVLHTTRGPRRYTALFSNTARAHSAGKTKDWVVLYCENGHGETRSTLITAEYGAVAGRRVVAGREDEGAGPTVR